MMQGPPAGGKSTKARELYEEDKLHRVIVNRDAIRDSRGDYWVPEQEQYISKLEEYAVRSAIESGLSPIIDATNLNPKTIQKWVDIAKEYLVDLTTIECVVPYKEALERDSKRERSVGVMVLRNFYKKYYPHLIAPMSDERKMLEWDPNKQKSIIVDVDGTLTLRNNRSPFDYEKAGEDSPDFRMCNIIKSLIESDENYQVFFLTGREDIGNCRQITEDWIGTHVYPKHGPAGFLPKDNWKLLMRSEGDHRPDEVVKKEIYENRIAPRYNVVAVFDDRDKVVKMWRGLGLLCVQPYWGDF